MKRKIKRYWIMRIQSNSYFMLFDCMYRRFIFDPASSIHIQSVRCFLSKWTGRTMSADRVGMNSRIVISESKSEREINSIPNGLVKPSYNRLSENVRKITPSEIICAMFCGGRKCKYENSSWSKTDMAVDGIYSHW